MEGGRGMMEDVVSRLREFMEQEARSCSMDFGCVTAEYVHRMWGGTVAIEEIRPALNDEFNSNNTKILNLEETKEKIASLTYIQNELNGIPNLV